MELNIIKGDFIMSYSKIVYVVKGNFCLVFDLKESSYIRYFEKNNNWGYIFKWFLYLNMKNVEFV